MEVKHCLSNIHDGGKPILPAVQQKLISSEMWDPALQLWNHGDHMPLLIYVGEHAYRRDQALTRREERHIARGWGPSSANRIRLMAKGKAKGGDTGAADGKGKRNEVKGDAGQGKGKGAK